MKKLVFLSILFFLVAPLFFSQTPVVNRSYDIKLNGTTCLEDSTKLCSVPENVGNRGLGAHIFIWSLQSGVMSSCNGLIQTSPDNKPTSTWSTQYTFDCSTSGTSSYLLFTANFIRIKISPFLVQSGTALVTINYAGYVIPPTSIATITNANLNNQNINNRRYCGVFAGATGGAKLAACFADLPSTGGIADASGMEGAQTISADPYTGITKPILLLIGAATWTSSVQLRVPANCGIVGIGKESKFSPLNATNPNQNLIRLQGDYSYIKNVYLYGSGTGTGGGANGNGGIWVGCGTTEATQCVANYNLVEDVTVENFHGRGISGDMSHAILRHNILDSSENEGIFLQTASTYNIVSQNLIYSNLYAGIDNIGSNNQLLDNQIWSNGGGSLDINAWEGILINYSPLAAYPLSGSLNIVRGNRINANQGCGIKVVGNAVTAGIVDMPYGNIIDHNVVSNHVTYTGSGGLNRNQASGGICVQGGNDNSVTDNISFGNVYNYVFSGALSNPSTGLIVKGNQSFNATLVGGFGATSGSGYYFPGSVNLDGTGGAPLQNAIIEGNFDNYAAKDGFRWALDGAPTTPIWSGLTVKNNHANHSGAVGFAIIDGNSFGNNVFIDNFSNAGVVDYSGPVANGLTANSLTPSVANGHVFTTQNSTSTTITNFTDGSIGQQVLIMIGDNNTIIGFSSGNLKGNSNTNLVTTSGDFLQCTNGGANWYCDSSHLAGNNNVVTQSGAKNANVILNGLAGTVIMNSAGLNGANLAPSNVVQFTIQNSSMGANDIMQLSIAGGGHQQYYTVSGSNAGAGFGLVTLVNISTAASNDAVVLGMQVVKQ